MRPRAVPLVVMTPLLAVLSACGPIPVEQAERNCLRSAELSTRPRGEMGVGIGTGRHGGLHTAAHLEIEMSGDYVMGRDPADVFNRCVLRRSGQMPTRPLYDHPGWRG